MLKKVTLDNLKPGAFVVRYGEGTFKEPWVELGVVIRRASQIDDLAELGVTHVYIDPEQGVDIFSPPRDRDPDLRKRFNYIAYREELVVAERQYAKGLEYVRDFLDRVRSGQPFDHRECLAFVDGFLDSIHRDDSAAVTLTTLRRFDEYTFTHCLNVGILSMVFGRFLGLGHDRLRQLGLAGILHDTGKALVPEAIMKKRGRLTGPEMDLARAHAIEGYLLLKGQDGVSPEVLRAVLEHHERFDGSGYPRGLTGDNIHQFARIIAVADVYDALSSDRPHQKGVPPAEALGKMLLRRDQDFFPDYVELFIKCMGIYPVGSFVRINTGEYGVVCGNDSRVPLKPRVRIVFDSRMRPVKAQIVDLAGEEYLSIPGRPEPKVTEYLSPADYKIDIRKFLG